MTAVIKQEAIPSELRALNQWVCWQYENRNGKRTKAPIDAKSNGKLLYAKSNDQATWSDFDAALATCEIHPELAGIGFCFAPGDGLTGIDLDHVFFPDTGELRPEAAEILAKFKGTYAEISPSGTGLRLFVYGKPRRSGKNVGKAKWLEVYSHPSSRYLTVTGNHWTGNAPAVTEQQTALDWLHGRFMKSTGEDRKPPVDAKPGPADPPNLDDAALLEKARAARNGVEFERLWCGDTSGHGGDESAADLALCNLLSFWTGADSNRIDRLFRQSGLMRPKWDSKRGETTYGAATVAKAINSTRETYSGRKPRGAARKAPERAADEGEKPLIQIEPGELHSMTDATERHLIERDPGIFQRADCLVRWAISKQETVHGIHRPGGTAIIKPIDADHLLDRISEKIDFEKWVAREKDWRKASPPRELALTLLARSGLWDFPRLVGVITAPTLRPDGSMIEKPGYDAKTGLLFVRQQEFPPIPAKPSKADGRAALDILLREVLTGFPFVETYHRSAALSAVLSVSVRHVLRHVPLHAFTAPKAGSGKSLLADCIAMIGTGYPAAILALTDDQAEMNKAITAILMQGDAIVNLDNIERGEALAGRELSKALTQEIYSGRILGASKVVSLPSCCLWLATGNQLQISGDMTRRVIPCEIDPACERPDEREFTRDLYEWIPANRPALVVAALTALRAYIVASKPRQAFKPLGGFADWSGLVRSALVWLGEADPLEGRETIEDADPERAKLSALLVAWHGAFGEAEATSREAICKATPRYDPEEGKEIPEKPALREVLIEHFKDRNGNLNRQFLGEYIGQNLRRIESGARFEVASKKDHGAKQWKVVITNQARFAECKKGEAGEAGEATPNPARENGRNEKQTSPVDCHFHVDSGEQAPQAPQAPRVAELIADGYERRNAEARAETERLIEQSQGVTR